MNPMSVIKDPRGWMQRYQETNDFADICKEIFIGQQYHWLAMQLRPGTTVIDIGAFMGDTAIYFAQFREVKSVMAFEPYPRNCSRAAKFISSSRKEIRDKIVMRMQGITSDGFSRDISGSDNYGSLADNPVSGYADSLAGSVTLGAVLAAQRNVAIKCDIEGGERDIFDGVDMEDVYAMQVEYHDTLPHLMKVLMGKGFAVTSEEFHSEGQRFKHYGMLYAIR